MPTDMPLTLKHIPDMLLTLKHILPKTGLLVIYQNGKEETILMDFVTDFLILTSALHEAM
jgi:hypothetical protein